MSISPSSLLSRLEGVKGPEGRTGPSYVAFEIGALGLRFRPHFMEETRHDSVVVIHTVTEVSPRVCYRSVWPQPQLRCVLSGTLTGKASFSSFSSCFCFRHKPGILASSPDSQRCIQNKEGLTFFTLHVTEHDRYST